MIILLFVRFKVGMCAKSKETESSCSLLCFSEGQNRTVSQSYTSAVFSFNPKGILLIAYNFCRLQEITVQLHFFLTMCFSCLTDKEFIKSSSSH